MKRIHLGVLLNYTNFIFLSVRSRCARATMCSTCSQSARACPIHPCGTPRSRSAAPRSPRCCTASRWSKKSTSRCSLAKILFHNHLVALTKLKWMATGSHNSLTWLCLGDDIKRSVDTSKWFPYGCKDGYNVYFFYFVYLTVNRQ